VFESKGSGVREQGFGCSRARVRVFESKGSGVREQGFGCSRVTVSNSRPLACSTVSTSPEAFQMSVMYVIMVL
jgi:hypothetical protein